MFYYFIRLDWQLLISVNIEGNCFIPLIQIHLLNDYNVLQDFCFRIFSFGKHFNILISFLKS